MIIQKQFILSFIILINGRAADNENGLPALPSPFNRCFTLGRIVAALKKAGAVPLNRKALESSQVRREVEDVDELDREEVLHIHSDCEVELISEDVTKNLSKNLQERNHAAVES